MTAQKIDVADVVTCDVVFLPETDNTSFKKIMRSIKQKSILVITEEFPFARRGAGISFVRDGDNLGFVVNKQALEARGLKASNLLLTLGKEI